MPSVAAEIAAKVDGAQELHVDGNTVRFRVPRGDTELPALLRALDQADVALMSVQVQRPTLDDVFLTMTGRSLRDEETPAEQEKEAVA
jgi:ABC-2 type transport system ATP-binding protein